MSFAFRTFLSTTTIDIRTFTFCKTITRPFSFLPSIVASNPGPSFTQLILAFVPFCPSSSTFSHPFHFFPFPHPRNRNHRKNSPQGKVVLFFPSSSSVSTPFAGFHRFSPNEATQKTIRPSFFLSRRRCQLRRPRQPSSPSPIRTVPHDSTSTDSNAHAPENLQRRVAHEQTYVPLCQRCSNSRCSPRPSTPIRQDRAAMLSTSWSWSWS